MSFVTFSSDVGHYAHPVIPQWTRCGYLVNSCSRGPVTCTHCLKYGAEWTRDTGSLIAFVDRTVFQWLRFIEPGPYRCRECGYGWSTERKANQHFEEEHA